MMGMGCDNELYLHISNESGDWKYKRFIGWNDFFPSDDRIKFKFIHSFIHMQLLLSSPQVVTPHYALLLSPDVGSNFS